MYIATIYVLSFNTNNSSYSSFGDDGIEPMILHMLGKCFTTELYSMPFNSLFHHPICWQVLTSLLIGPHYVLTEDMHAVSLCIAKVILLQQDLSWMSTASFPILFLHTFLPVSLSFPVLTD